MSVDLDISELTARFLDFRVALVVAEGLDVALTRSAELDGWIADAEEACRARWEGVDLSAIPGIAAWRAAYKGFGIKKTSYRSSVERLVKRVKAGDALPRVNTLVDLYNTISLSHVFCCGADDLDRVAPPLAFRFAREGDTFVDMGAEAGEDPSDPPKAGEVVLADARHVLCRRWNWRQDARSAITPATKRAVITVQANGAGSLDAAVADLTTGIARHCGAQCRVGVADAARAVIRV